MSVGCHHETFRSVDADARVDVEVTPKIVFETRAV